MKKLTVLCISSYEKGFGFMKQAKEEGSRVLLLTSQSLYDTPCPKECMDEIFYMPHVKKELNNKYKIPKAKNEYAAILHSLAKQE